MSQTSELRQEWNRIAEKWIERIRGRGDQSREFLLDEWMLRAVGDVRGLDIVDLGCGEGRFGRMLAERGARVVGVDACDAMTTAANESRGERETYIVGDMEHLPAEFVNTFDMAVAYLSLIDCADLTAAVREAFRILKPGGLLLACNLSPMVTAGNRWLRDADGQKICFYLDNYFDESRREMYMCGGMVTNLHRTFTSYINAFLAAGFVLEGIDEPFPSAEQLKACPENADNLRVPLFIIYRLRRPS